MTRWLAVIAIVTLALGSVGHAAPDPGRPPPMSAAAQLYFDRGSQAYEAGAYEQAIAAFEHGQRLDSHPDFLYALAQAYRKHGDCSRATSLYRAFLATRPPATEVARVELNLARCPSEPEARPWYTDTLGGVLAGAGLIGMGIGAGYLITAERDIVAANRSTQLAARMRLGDDGTHERRVGIWLVAGGGTLALAAVVRYALHRPAGRAGGNIGIAPHRGGGSVSWAGRF